METNRVSIAQIRLAGLLKEHRSRAARQQTVTAGELTVGEALAIALERIQSNPERKPLAPITGWQH